MKLTLRSPATDGFHRVEVHRVFDTAQARLISQAVDDSDPEYPNTCLQEDFRLLNMAQFMANHKLRMLKARRITDRWKRRQLKPKKTNVVRLRGKK